MMKPSRKRLFIFMASAAFFTAVEICAQEPNAQAKLQHLADASSLVKDGSLPWHLRMTFQLFDLTGKLQEVGSIEEWWESPTKSRLAVISPSYRLMRPSDNDRPEIHNRESYLVRTLLEQVTNPIPAFDFFKGMLVTEEDRDFGFDQLNCYKVSKVDQATGRPFPYNGPQFCADADRDVLRLHLDLAGFSAARKNATQFRNIEVGVDYDLSYSGKRSITGHIESLESFDPSASTMLFTKDSKGVTVVVPGVFLAGSILRKEQPIYPSEARRAGISGTVLLEATISKQGDVVSLDAITSPDELLTESAIKAVKNWKYSPYMLNGKPTEVDTVLTVNYSFNK